ncbi:MAG TPA: type IV toxin-antitoxin system AbiEi family antitoxin, partial [Terriglobia bacterium]|nr:type IV toxin-antitoxin system AbiEi family antitoxin [Terriglobia bacterium]
EPAGLKVLFAFLCDPTLVDRPFREIATTADVAHGTVGEVMAELPHRGYVYDFGKATGGRKLQNTGDLLDKWAEAYARKLKPKLFLGRYRAQDPGWWQELDATKYAMVLGAEPAAARLTRHLKPAMVTLYGERAEPRLLVDHALRTDPRGDVEVGQRFWRVRTDEDKEGLAPLPLIYADLLATADPRCIETAGLVRERYLDRFERKA